MIDAHAMGRRVTGAGVAGSRLGGSATVAAADQSVPARLARRTGVARAATY